MFLLRIHSKTSDGSLRKQQMSAACHLHGPEKFYARAPKWESGRAADCARRKASGGSKQCWQKHYVLSVMQRASKVIDSARADSWSCSLAGWLRKLERGLADPAARVAFGGPAPAEHRLCSLAVPPSESWVYHLESLHKLFNDHELLGVLV